ncbi:UNVERIFIED_CONTAM: hypothetical protein GTU68_016882 [Idotea baltica]|nr:hypothetical protein [Idotea baltica]
MKAGVYKSLEEAFSQNSEQVIDILESAGERGRGGSGCSTSAKWRAAANVEADQRYVIANGDEGDPGSFVDRVLMEGDPHSILEGMILCGYAIGADKGFVYIRSEYPQAKRVMQNAIEEARAEGVLGNEIYGTDFDFDVTIVEGTGVYVRGVETALIKSIEELQGEVQSGSPFPGKEGLYGKPTVINNVETLMNVPYIISVGPEKYRALGTPATSGTKAICLNYGFAHSGVIEIEFGTTFREVIENIGGGGKDGRPLLAVLVGGPMGTLLMPEDWDLPICYDVLARNDVQLGHGGIIAIPEDCNFRDLFVHLVEFMVNESRGRCESDRLGSPEPLDAAIEEARTCTDLEKMLSVIEAGSHCAFGHYTPGPIRALVTHFGSKIIGERTVD